MKTRKNSLHLHGLFAAALLLVSTACDSAAPNQPAAAGTGGAAAPAASPDASGAGGEGGAAGSDASVGSTGGASGGGESGGSAGGGGAAGGTGMAGGATGGAAGGGAGGSSTPSGPPLAAGLGVPCTTNTDCSAGGECVNPSTVTLRPDCTPGTFCTSITLYRAALGWSKGYCATSCAGGASCGTTSTYSGSCLFNYSGSSLTIIGGQEPTKCVVRCGPKNECPSGLVCSSGLTCGDPTSGSLKLCLPCGPDTAAAKAATAAP